MIRTGVIGAGWHSQRDHGPALARCSEEDGDVELAAVCDLDRERAEEYASAFGFAETYTQHARMIESESLDAIVAVTPIEATAAVAGEVLETEVPVLIEKPPGESIADARALRDRAERRDVTHGVSFNRRFNPALARAREWMTDRGEPIAGIARQRRVDRLEPEFVLDAGIHPVDTLLAVMGPATDLSARRFRSREDGGESAVARLSFETGEEGSLTVLPDAGEHGETYEFSGPGYTVTVDVAEAAVSAREGGEESLSWRLDPDAPPYERNGTLAETRAFLDAVRGTRAFEPTLDDAVQTMRAIETIDAGGDARFE